MSIDNANAESISTRELQDIRDNLRLSPDIESLAQDWSTLHSHFTNTQDYHHYYPDCNVDKTYEDEWKDIDKYRMHLRTEESLDYHQQWSNAHNVSQILTWATPNDIQTLTRLWFDQAVHCTPLFYPANSAQLSIYERRYNKYFRLLVDITGVFILCMPIFAPHQCMEVPQRTPLGTNLAIIFCCLVQLFDLYLFSSTTHWLPSKRKNQSTGKAEGEGGNNDEAGEKLHHGSPATGIWRFLPFSPVNYQRFDSTIVFQIIRFLTTLMILVGILVNLALQGSPMWASMFAPLIVIGLHQSLIQLSHGLYHATLKTLRPLQLNLLFLFCWSFVGHVLLRRYSTGDNSSVRFSSYFESVYTCFHCMVSRPTMLFRLHPVFEQNAALSIFFVVITLFGDIMLTTYIISMGIRSFRKFGRQNLECRLKYRFQALHSLFLMYGQTEDSPKSPSRLSLRCDSFLDFVKYIPDYYRQSITQSNLQLMFYFESAASDNQVFEHAPSVDKLMETDVRTKASLCIYEKSFFRLCGMLSSKMVFSSPTLLPSTRFQSLNDDKSSLALKSESWLMTLHRKHMMDVFQWTIPIPIPSCIRTSGALSVIDAIVHFFYEGDRSIAVNNVPYSTVRSLRVFFLLQPLLYMASIVVLCFIAQRDVPVSCVIVEWFLLFAFVLEHRVITLNAFNSPVNSHLKNDHDRLTIKNNHLFQPYLDMYFNPWINFASFIALCVLTSYLNNAEGGKVAFDTARRGASALAALLLIEGIRLIKIALLSKPFQEFTAILPILCRVLLVFLLILYFFTMIGHITLCGKLDTTLINDMADDDSPNWLPFHRFVHFNTFFASFYTVAISVVIATWSMIMDAILTCKQVPRAWVYLYFYIKRGVIFFVVVPLLISCVVQSYLQHLDRREVVRKRRADRRAMSADAPTNSTTATDRPVSSLSTVSVAEGSLYANPLNERYHISLSKALIDNVSRDPTASLWSTTGRSLIQYAQVRSPLETRYPIATSSANSSVFRSLFASVKEMDELIDEVQQVWNEKLSSTTNNGQSRFEVHDVLVLQKLSDWLKGRQVLVMQHRSQIEADLRSEKLLETKSSLPSETSLQLAAVWFSEAIHGRSIVFPTSPLQVKCLQILTHRAVKYFVSMVIILNILVVFLVVPRCTIPNDGPSVIDIFSYDKAIVVNFICAFVYAIELALEWTAKYPQYASIFSKNAFASVVALLFDEFILRSIIISFVCWQALFGLALPHTFAASCGLIRCLLPFLLLHLFPQYGDMMMGLKQAISKSLLVYTVFVSIIVLFGFLGYLWLHRFPTPAERFKTVSLSMLTTLSSATSAPLSLYVIAPYFDTVSQVVPLFFVVLTYIVEVLCINMIVGLGNAQFQKFGAQQLNAHKLSRYISLMTIFKLLSNEKNRVSIDSFVSFAELLPPDFQLSRSEIVVLLPYVRRTVHSRAKFHVDSMDDVEFFALIGCAYNGITFKDLETPMSTLKATANPQEEHDHNRQYFGHSGMFQHSRSVSVSSQVNPPQTPEGANGLEMTSKSPLHELDPSQASTDSDGAPLAPLHEFECVHLIELKEEVQSMDFVDIMPSTWIPDWIVTPLSNVASELLTTALNVRVSKLRMTISFALLDVFALILCLFQFVQLAYYSSSTSCTGDWSKFGYFLESCVALEIIIRIMGVGGKRLFFKQEVFHIARFCLTLVVIGCMIALSPGVHKYSNANNRSGCGMLDGSSEDTPSAFLLLVSAQSIYLICSAIVMRPRIQIGGDDSFFSSFGNITSVAMPATALMKSRSTVSRRYRLVSENVLRAMVILLSVLYFFAMIAQDCYCGVLNSETAAAPPLGDDDAQDWTLFAGMLNFNDHPRSMFSLFEMMALGGWTFIMDAVVKSLHVSPYATYVFFFVFRLVLTLAVLPLLLGFIVRSIIVLNDQVSFVKKRKKRWMQEKIRRKNPASITDNIPSTGFAHEGAAWTTTGDSMEAWSEQVVDITLTPSYSRIGSDRDIREVHLEIWDSLALCDRDSVAARDPSALALLLTAENASWKLRQLIDSIEQQQPSFSSTSVESELRRRCLDALDRCDSLLATAK